MPLPTNGPTRLLLNQYMGPATKAGPKDLYRAGFEGRRFRTEPSHPLPEKTYFT